MKNFDRIEDVTKGISLGLEHSYRSIKIGGDYVIYRMSDGEVIECIPQTSNPVLYKNKAIDRLYEINNLKKELSDEVKWAIDSTG